jgi:hypothetical protein
MTQKNYFVKLISRTTSVKPEKMVELGAGSFLFHKRSSNQDLFLDLTDLKLPSHLKHSSSKQG